MSKIDFRSGSLTGRLAGMVGATWKGIDYVRKMVIPANPNTTLQQGVRDVFKKLVKFGRRVNSTILKDYIIPKPKKMSPFNKFIQNNKVLIETGVFAFPDMVVAIGSLFFAGISAATQDDVANEVDVTWANTLEGEALATDKVLIIAYNATQDTYAYSTNKERSDVATVISLNNEAADVIHVYMFMVQGDNLSSETAYQECVPE